MALLQTAATALVEEASPAPDEGGLPRLGTRQAEPIIEGFGVRSEFVTEADNPAAPAFAPDGPPVLRRPAHRQHPRGHPHRDWMLEERGLLKTYPAPLA